MPWCPQNDLEPLEMHIKVNIANSYGYSGYRRKNNEGSIMKKLRVIERIFYKICKLSTKILTKINIIRGEQFQLQSINRSSLFKLIA